MEAYRYPGLELAIICVGSLKVYFYCPHDS